MWYDHQILRLRDTFAKNRQTWQKCASFSRFTDLCGKKSKIGLCRNMGKRFPDVPTESFFWILFFQIRKTWKTSTFLAWITFLESKWMTWSWWLLLIFIPYSLTLSLTLSSALSIYIIYQDINYRYSLYKNKYLHHIYI